MGDSRPVSGGEYLRIAKADSVSGILVVDTFPKKVLTSDASRFIFLMVEAIPRAAVEPTDTKGDARLQRFRILNVVSASFCCIPQALSR